MLVRAVQGAGDPVRAGDLEDGGGVRDARTGHRATRDDGQLRLAHDADAHRPGRTLEDRHVGEAGGGGRLRAQCPLLVDEPDTGSAGEVARHAQQGMAVARQHPGVEQGGRRLGGGTGRRGARPGRVCGEGAGAGGQHAGVHAGRARGDAGLGGGGRLLVGFRVEGAGWHGSTEDLRLEIARVGGRTAGRPAGRAGRGRPDPDRRHGPGVDAERVQVERVDPDQVGGGRRAEPRRRARRRRRGGLRDRETGSQRGADRARGSEGGEVATGTRHTKSSGNSEWGVARGVARRDRRGAGPRCPNDARAAPVTCEISTATDKLGHSARLGEVPLNR